MKLKYLTISHNFQEAEEKRRVKHKKMEEERENMRAGIREKVFNKGSFTLRDETMRHRTHDSLSLLIMG